MRYLSGEELESARAWIFLCEEIARKSTCNRVKCGSIIINNGLVIGTGFNSPPADLESQRKCAIDKKDLDPKVSDKTCCIHAEQRAIIDALKNNSDKIIGSRIYFVRLNENEKMVYSGMPYCTHCSKLVLDVGISEFVLFHKEGIYVYDTKEYNLLSFNFNK